jgi:hemolysin activation/secretion protein
MKHLLHRHIAFSLLLPAIFFSFAAVVSAEEVQRFHIKGFIVEGNTLLADKPFVETYDDSPRFDALSVQEILEEFLGPDQSVEVIEAARDKLERSYHEQGYPTVLVNIPEQTVEEGFVKLQVVESVIRRVRVTGNRYFTMENILKDVPTLDEGEIIYMPHLQEELALVNRNPDMRVEPVLVPGKTFGTVDVELKVTDKLPLHGSLELNNRASADTSPLRLNGVLRYDNLWQKEHSVSLQYQTAPKKTEEVQVIAASYVMPTPWNDDHRLALFSVWSDSQSAFGEGFQMIGSGYTFGVRYVMPLAPYKLYTHNISVGFDYKDFDETATFYDEDLKTPISYLPLTFSYNSSLPDETGLTSFSSSLNMSMRGLVSDQREFEIKRYMARANYIYLTAGVERMQKLPAKCSLFVKIDGQISDQPLISNEQFTSGGMDTVRGYKESSAAGDEGIHATVELSGPDMAEYFEFAAKADLFPYLFYDLASMKIREPLPGQEVSIGLESAGLGLRGKITQYLDYETTWAMALKDRDPIEAGQYYFNFKLKMNF